ncbi:MAG: hypothetical protein ABIW76_17070 [Fibrobacteria bacterium]
MPIDSSIPLFHGSGDEDRFNFRISLALLLSLVICACGKEKRHSMFIRIPKDTFEFGDAIPAEIVFVNTTSHPLVLPENPRKSLDLLMHAVTRETKEDLNYSMGKMTVTGSGEGEFAVNVPIKEETEIAPHSNLSFTSDLNDRLYLYPGHYDCFLTNYLVEKSNPVALTVSFTPASVGYLLKTSVDSRQSFGKREWACSWLKKVIPDLDFKLPSDADTGDAGKAMEIHNHAEYQRAQKWWDENRKSEGILKVIHGLNP